MSPSDSHASDSVDLARPIRRRVGKLARDVSRGNLHAVPPELVLRERREGVGNLFDEIASREVRVCEESTREARERADARAAAVAFPPPPRLGNRVRLSLPTRDQCGTLFAWEEPVEQNVEVEAGDVVTHQHVRVQLLQLGEQKAQETALRGLRGQHHRAGSLRHRVLGVLLRHRRVPAGRERDPVQPAHDGKVPEVVQRVPVGRGLIALDVAGVHDDAEAISLTLARWFTTVLRFNAATVSVGGTPYGAATSPGRLTDLCPRSTVTSSLHHDFCCPLGTSRAPWMEIQVGPITLDLITRCSSEGVDAPSTATKWRPLTSTTTPAPPPGIEP